MFKCYINRNYEKLNSNKENYIYLIYQILIRDINHLKLQYKRLMRDPMAEIKKNFSFLKL